MRKRENAIEVQGMPAPGEERDPQFVTALARGLDVLRSFRKGDMPLGNQELSRRTRLPKATVSRLTYTLSRLGYLDYWPDASRYSLSAGALALGFTALGSLGIRDVARPFMQELADYTGVAVALGTRDRYSMVYIGHCRGEIPVHIDLEVGSHIKLGASAMGRAFIAGLPAPEREKLMEQLAAREGERWPRLKAGIEQAVEDLQTRGFVLSAGDWQPEVSAVGVPLFFGSGPLRFAINCGGPSFVTPRDKLVEDYGPRLVAVAARIKQVMGAG
jgi:DNA-binding IclR family transcriptional regulator